MPGLVLAVAAFAAGPQPGFTSDPDVRGAMSQIAAPAGGSVLDAMRACGFRVQWQDSWAARQSPASDIFTLQVLFTQPALGRLGRDTVARWKIRGSRATPDNGWARAFSLRRDPCRGL